MSLDTLTSIYLPAIENELKTALERAAGPQYDHLYAMMAYHMGWEGEGAGPKVRGKRIRPVLLLLTTDAAGGDWHRALPAAAAVELIHNFSLLHDDIEDNSPLRRGRPTAWTQWGVPQAINTGDSMFSLAHLAILDLERSTSLETAFRANQILENTCLHLTQGQFLDISYQERRDLSLKDYWPMVTGKTAALLAACTELGALVAGVEAETRAHYRQFGLNLGLAFQVLDDYLGIWGDSRVLGKSIASDLVEGKKSLPVLYGLEKNGPFAQRWAQGPISIQEVPQVASQLESEGARAYTQESADRLTAAALEALAQAAPQGEAGQALTQLTHQLLQRQV
ncbi:MAG: polyprenyl synthetase family protein [Anaerolineales bacterium]|nr:polyprenyl synthetase family protein [Anaerolineales bacterium]